MTERAKIREEYKKKKRLPAPEISKPSRKRKKYFYKIEQRLTEEGYQRQLETFNNNGWCFHRGSKGPDREWHSCYSKYHTLKDAEKGLQSMEKYKAASTQRFHSWFTDYEYRIVEIK